jgi:predicted TIM-barrel enzyme
MALMTLGTTTGAGVSATENVQAGITAITQASIERAAGTIVRAKNGAGDVKAVLIGKEVITMNVSGYSTAAAGAVLGSAIKVGGKEGKVVSASIEATAEDFTKFSAQGAALATVPTP